MTLPKLPEPAVPAYGNWDDRQGPHFTSAQMMQFQRDTVGALQRKFWDACKPHGKVGEVVYMTYKAQA